MFLARQNYRRRRLADAARLLPVLGGLLFLLPILGTSTGAITTAGGGLFVFSVWVALIVVAAFLARRLTAGDNAGPDGDSG
nr:hypothetical protein [Aliiroseovarius subalbicans]